MDSELAQCFASMPAMPEFNSIADIRALVAHSQSLRLTSSAPTDVSEENREIPVRDGTEISVRIHRPKDAGTNAESGPLFVMYHGGGYCFGNAASIENECRMFVQKFRAIIINVEYRLAPEYPWPVPVQDAYDALKWAARNAYKLGSDPKKGFIVGGSSAGANFATVASHLAVTEALSPPLTGVYISVPPVVHPDAVPERYTQELKSYVENADAPILNARLRELFLDNYKPDPKSPMFSSLLSPSHKGLPRHYIQVCGLDPLRDEGLIYEKVLREDAGVETKLDIYDKVPHGFWILFPQISKSREFYSDLAEGVKWLLEA
ncbi:alpha/beta-hydrolase [Penicillium lagena]|uniref:alpha/beta-hydrolase n=1 Tax=Penicillium lagena TaxID=94218 RepID=UPI00253F6A8C|nr:alpha/beta-hydrolase [Penicillium lagena]KAJ5612026.1 alpha/beta-hydrolase [Penicillium lagena]